MEDTKDDSSRWNEYAAAIPVIGKYLQSKDKVAVLRMSGVIADSSMMRRAGISYHKFRDAIGDAFELSKVRAIALCINSPGGAPAQCSLISAQIRRLAEEKDVPVYAFVEDVAASGGYWLACTADTIFAQNSSIVGSIGVISSGFGFEEFIKKHDVERRVHTSGKDKSFLDPFKPEKAEDLSRLKTVQRNIHQSFKDWVLERRAGRLNGDENDLMEGAFWTGQDALSRGLIDGIGDVATVMHDKFGKDIQFVDCTPGKKGLLSMLPIGGESSFDVGGIVDVAEEKSAWARFGL